ncbi:hypothetical protein VH12019_00361 [Vibrio phage VH1_2019]|nr:hypothetical protein pp2_095 [Vibrio phage phi-pp2]QHJ74280.1 hypothetical protein VH12019_00361 [Vibrio phage VH1_2019]QIW90937.1 hypothetical protein COHAPHLL_00074 [Vibrio phage V09]WOL25008.1 hypothetical protein [Vibrio phage PG216]
MNIQDLTEIFINFHDENYEVDATLDRIEDVIDREDVHGVMLPFSQGVSIFIEKVDNTDLTIAEYEAFVVEKLEEEFNDEIGEIEFIY